MAIDDPGNDTTGGRGPANAPGKAAGRLTRRRLLQVGAVAAGTAVALPILEACAPATGPAAGGAGAAATAVAAAPVIYRGEVFDAGGATLKVAMWGSLWEQFTRDTLLTDFQKQFNCTISYDNAFPYYPKLVAGSKDDPTYDVVNQGIGEAIQSQNAGFFVPVSDVRANVPNSQDCWDFAFQGTGLMYLWDGYGLAYRKDKVAFEPKTWKDFWDTRYDGKRAIYGIDNEITQDLLMLAGKLYGSDYTDLTAALAAMKKLLPAKITDLTPAMGQLLAQGDALVGPLNQGVVVRLQQTGAPLGWAQMAEATPAQFQNISVTAGSKNKRLGYAFINRLLDPEIQTKYVAYFRMRPANKKAKISDDLTALGVANNADAVKGLWVAPWKWFFDNQVKITDEFNKLLKG